MKEARQKTVEKIRKLLRLAKSSNEHEAALAAAHAQRLLSEHNLREEDLSERETPPQVGEAYADTVKKPANWVYGLAAATAKAFDCHYAHSPFHGRMCFYGCDIDQEVAAFTFGYLYRTIGRLATAFMRKSQNRRLTPKGQRKVRVSYCTGAAGVVALKLRQQKAETPITCTALVLVKEALINAYTEKIGIQTVERQNDSLSDRAYWAGVRDGGNIDHGRKGLKSKDASGSLRIEHKG